MAHILIVEDEAFPTAGPFLLFTTATVSNKIDGFLL